MILNTAVETMTPSEKTALQNQQLQTLVERAYKKTSFYQERMDSVGLTPADIQSVQDISKLPFMTAADLSANYPFGLLTIPISSVARFQQTADLGGAIGFTRQDIAGQVEMIARSLVACHITMTSVLMILPAAFDTCSTLSLQQAAESLGVTVISGRKDDVPSQIKTILDFGVTTLFSSPAPLLQLADFLKRQGFSMHDLPLMNLVCEAHHCPADIREELAAKFQLPIYTLYGRADIMSLGIAGECHQQHGLHIQEDHFYPEIINPHTGTVVADHQPGELVLTTLSREATPFIRYRTGEIAVLMHERCTCGRTSARLTFVP